MKKIYVRPTSELVFADSEDAFMKASSITNDENDTQTEIKDWTDEDQSSTTGGFVVGARGESAFGDDMW